MPSDCMNVTTSLLREVLRAVEGHVLDEVREAALVVVFEHRAGIDREPKLGAALRLPVGADVVAEAVRQRADGDLRIDRHDLVERGGLNRRGIAGCCARGRSRPPLRSPTTGGSIGRESDKASSSSPRIGQRHLLVHCIDGWDAALGLAAAFDGSSPAGARRYAATNGRPFAQPAIGTYGNSGYNAYLGPGTRTIDLALVRSFRFPNSHSLEARVEAFNALNWLRPQNPNATLSSPTFGQILTSYDPRVMQFGLKYQF